MKVKPEEEGGNYHICWYGMCHLFEQKIDLGVSSLVKSQLVINFEVSPQKNNSFGY